MGLNSLGVNPIRRRRVWVGTFAGLAVMTLLVSGSGCTIMEPSGQKSPAIRRAVVSDGWLAMGTFFEADLRVRPDEAGRARAWLVWGS